MTVRKVFVAGIYEHPLRDAPGRTVYDIKAECALRALEDAGLAWSDVQGLYDAGEAEATLPGIGLAEYLGFSPDVVDTTSVGGSSYEFHVAHAARDIAAGRIDVALITYGSMLRQAARGAGGLNTTPSGVATPIASLERPYGLSLVGNYALAARRHMHEYGTTPAQLAEIAMVTRRHALRNPVAVAGLESIGIRDVSELTVDKVLGSRTISDPLHLLDCCLVTDGGGAVVLVSEAVAAGTRSRRVQVLGSGEAIGYLAPGGSITSTAARRSAPVAYREAGVAPADIDVAMLYDSFTITVLLLLEDLGFCEKGEGGAFAATGALAFDRAGAPALNTDGGGLSSTHPGMRGIFLVIEATRQLRGESTAQVPGARLAIAHGNGGYVATRHAAATVILGAA
jgi:acetyl-CoA C-acetyltransferase